MTNELRQRALRLYRRPFRFDGGYVWDAAGEMVADDRVADSAELQIPMSSLALARVRGWGRISYLPNAPELQDAVGELIALALTEYWERHKDELKDSGK